MVVMVMVMVVVMVMVLVLVLVLVLDVIMDTRALLLLLLLVILADLGMKEKKGNGHRGYKVTIGTVFVKELDPVRIFLILLAKKKDHQHQQLNRIAVEVVVSSGHFRQSCANRRGGVRAEVW